MNIFSKDFISNFSEMLKVALKNAVNEVLLELKDEDKFLLTRKEIAEAIGCDVETFDANYRYLPGFPYHKKGQTESWNKKEVFEFLHKNKLLK
ncbi:hypothetical protein TMUPMC115_0218 [Tetragenococcus muriaticus PMC-11-5]|uniref:Uncharacterized protein n=1 Tax=Tetragenococcus muriaticus PMC-11-5 TaxID=1302649 RepID=A0A091C9S4_9ENTE|nr:hypothetical protein [Tetragenococcus muriaticus]KFN93620.1 hypothetical protein TMUPMC115_0218 [Tetragenococcus muriaticus PMC-11-5]